VGGDGDGDDGASGDESGGEYGVMTHSPEDVERFRIALAAKNSKAAGGTDGDDFDDGDDGGGGGGDDDGDDQGVSAGGAMAWHDGGRDVVTGVKAVDAGDDDFGDDFGC
jgi:hypothetical protein